jgi:hypothetical protein
MKKKILLPALLVLVATATYFVFSSSISKPIARSIKLADRSMDAPTDFDVTYLESLKDVGFNSLKDVKHLKNIQNRKDWMDKCGVYFLGDDEMTKFLTDNDFIIGAADRFLCEIPKEAGVNMIQRFRPIRDSLTMYYLHIYNTFDMVYCLEASEMAIKPENIIRRKEEESFVKYLKPSTIEERKIPAPYVWDMNIVRPEIQIIAAAKCFNTEGMIIEDRILKATPPKDPIAVVKVKDGWIELVNW